MKLLKTILITSLALLLTGCYTQLEYSQTMKKVTDEKPSKQAGVYAWNGEEKEEKKAQNKQQNVDEQYAEYESEGEEYIPIYYKDYEYATKYGDVYNVNNYFGNDWYGYNAYYPYSSFRSHYAWNPFYYDRWHNHSFFGYGYHRPTFGMSFSIGWGSGYHHGFYHPFFDPYFDYYWYRYHSPFAYNYRSFYGKSGYGHGYYPDKKVRQDENIRYGPRSVGTNRVATDGNRSRSVTGRSASVSNESTSGARTRSTGTLRTRSSDKGSTSVTRTKRDTNSSSSSTRVRSRSTDTSNSSGNRDTIIKRSRQNTMPIVIDENQLKQLRSRSSNSPNEGLINRSRLNNERKKTPTFFNRMKNFLQDGTTGRISNGNTTRSIRSRSSSSSTNRSRINRNSSSNRSSVTKSKSSSSNSRSRGSSSSSRSRSGGSSSDSDRSRDN